MANIAAAQIKQKPVLDEPAAPEPKAKTRPDLSFVILPNKASYPESRFQFLLLGGAIQLARTGWGNAYDEMQHKYAMTGGRVGVDEYRCWVNGEVTYEDGFRYPRDDPNRFIKDKKDYSAHVRRGFTRTGARDYAAAS